MSNRIRPARPDDLSFLQTCAREAYAPYVPRIGREPAPMVADFATHIELGEAWLAIDPKDSPAGFIIMFARAEAWFIENVAVLPARHGEGFGGALLRMAEGTAQDRGKPLLRLYTNDAMTDNLTLYPALGFRETHRIHEDGFDRVYFEKTITAA